MQLIDKYYDFKNQLSFTRETREMGDDVYWQYVGFIAWLLLEGDSPFEDEIIDMFKSLKIDYRKCYFSFSEAESWALNIFDELKEKSPTADDVIVAASKIVPRSKRGFYNITTHYDQIRQDHRTEPTVTKDDIAYYNSAKNTLGCLVKITVVLLALLAIKKILT